MTGGAVAAPSDPVEASGATVEDAVRTALRELGIERDQAQVEVLSAGVVGIPGESVSGSEARVRVSRIDAYALRARVLLEELLRRMEIPARVESRRPGEVRSGLPPVLLDVSGDDLGLLIGWRGETLRALQTVVNLMMGGDDHVPSRRIIIDVERYRARREDQVRAMAIRIAHQVKRTGEPATLDVMHAYERRAVHLALEGDEGVRTESEGAEPERRIIIHPTGPAIGGEPYDTGPPPGRFGGGARGREGGGRGRDGGDRFGGGQRPQRW